MEVATRHIRCEATTVMIKTGRTRVASTLVCALNGEGGGSAVGLSEGGINPIGIEGGGEACMG